MPKLPDEIKQEIEIGEKILIAGNIIKLGTRPGLLDKMLGEEDLRRMIIDERNFDRESDEYKKLCQKAYKKFRKKFKNKDGVVDEESFGKALEKANEIYSSLLKEAEEKDGVNCASVALNSLILAATATGVAERVSGSSTQKENKGTGSDLETFSHRSKALSIASSPESDLNLRHPERSEGSHAVVERDPSLRISKRNSEAGNDNGEETSYLESATKTFHDAINYLTEKSGGIPYGMLMFGASLSQNPSLRTAGIAAAMLSALPESEAIKVGDKDYKTAVYCGPRINCKDLRKQAKANKIELIEFDQKQEITSPKPED
ncbi:MAG: hypothetical protein KGQ36_04660 [Rickettsiales bacterium]|nr:hypothetical protein [Rickettsiales bacterium]